MNAEIQPRPETHSENNSRAYVRNTLMASQAYQTGESHAARVLDSLAVSYLNELTIAEQTAASIRYTQVWEQWRDSGFSLETYVSLIVGLF